LQLQGSLLNDADSDQGTLRTEMTRCAKLRHMQCSN
jgi:hypothetical protein